MGFIKFAVPNSLPIEDAQKRVEAVVRLPNATRGQGDNDLSRGQAGRRAVHVRARPGGAAAQHAPRKSLRMRSSPIVEGRRRRAGAVAPEAR